MFGLGMVVKEIYFAYSTRHLFREQGLYQETWLLSALICMEKAFGSRYTGLRERMSFILFVCYVFHLLKLFQLLKFFN